MAKKAAPKAPTFTVPVAPTAPRKATPAVPPTAPKQRATPAMPFTPPARPVRNTAPVTPPVAPVRGRPASPGKSADALANAPGQQGKMPPGTRGKKK